LRGREAEIYAGPDAGFQVREPAGRKSGCGWGGRGGFGAAVGEGRDLCCCGTQGARGTAEQRGAYDKRAHGVACGCGVCEVLDVRDRCWWFRRHGI
jgi:hypothetical protein